MQEHLTQEKSIYIQISEMIETDICRGILLEEEKVPSTNELAKQLKVKDGGYYDLLTGKGVNILVDEGILYKKRGIGMFVSKGAKDMILNKRKGAFYENYVKSLIEEAKSIGITTKELIKMIEESEG